MLVSSLWTAVAGAVVLAAGLGLGWWAWHLSRVRSGINVKVPKTIASRDDGMPLRSLADLLASLTQRRSLETAYEVVAQKTGEALSANFAAVFTRKGEVFELRSTSGLPADGALRLGRDNPVVRYVEEGDKPIAHLAPGHPQLALFRKLMPQIRELVCAPLVDTSGVFGFLMAANKREGGGFTPQDLETLSYLAIPTALHIHNALLNQELEQTIAKTIIAMAKALEARDQYTLGHSERVARYAVDFAQWLDFDSRTVQLIREAALLHDLGKIGIPDCILLKPGRLTPDEHATMQRHPDIGYEILKELKFLDEQTFMVRHHHEKFDGTGYPVGLRGEQIPEPVMILSLADVYDALTSERPHRSAMSHEDALAEMSRMSGTNFDPRYFRKFIDFMSATRGRY
ncbi:MAG TPA: HD domain-containing phosphohydrolase, partial [Candidatus Xenobia bacterium]